MSQDPATVQDLLPPLPEPDDTDGCTYAAYSGEAMQAYARTAVEAAISREREAWRQATQVPTVEKGAQDWATIDGAVAFHLIERHADSWADAGQMMDEWAEAQAPKYAAIRSRK